MFSLCYLVPTLAIVLGANIVQIDNLANVEQLSQYGFLFVLSSVFFNKVLKRFPHRRVSPAISINMYWSPKTCFIGFLSFFLITKIITGYYGVGDATDYSQQYVVRASMPQMINQTIMLLHSFQWMFIFLLLGSSFGSSTRKYSLRFIGFVFFVLLVDMWITNSRSNFVTFSILFMAAYTLYNRPIGLKKEIGFAILFVLIMGIFAFKRVSSGDAISFDLIGILIPGEFVFIYSNALHLVSIYSTSEFMQPPGSSYLQALIAFIPKQFNEGKWDPSTWYVKEYFPAYAEAGGGLAFGIIPEAIINWGLISIIFQALIIVIIFKIAYSYACMNRSSGPNVWVVFYLFSFSQIYQVIRSQSFSIIGGLFLGFVVPFLMLLVLSRIGFRSNHYKNV